MSSKDEHGANLDNGKTVFDEIKSTLHYNILVKQSAEWRDALKKVGRMLNAADGR